VSRSRSPDQLAGARRSGLQPHPWLQPGAGCLDDRRRAQGADYEVTLHRTRTFGAVAGKPGEVCAIGPESIEIALQGGRLELRTVRLDSGAKISGAALATSLALEVGAPLQSAAK